MKKLETEAEKQKREQRKKTVIGLILGLILLSSTVAFAFLGFERNSNENVQTKVSVNGLDFYSNGEIWQTQLSGYNFYFKYLPNETNYLTINKTLQDYANKPLYIVSDNTESSQEIIGNIGSFIERYSPACLKGAECKDNSPIKDCSDNVIIIQEKNTTRVSQDNGCVFIVSDNVLKETDAFLYRILGIQ